MLYFWLVYLAGFAAVGLATFRHLRNAPSGHEEGTFIVAMLALVAAWAWPAVVIGRLALAAKRRS